MAKRKSLQELLDKKVEINSQIAEAKDELATKIGRYVLNKDKTIKKLDHFKKSWSRTDKDGN